MKMEIQNKEYDWKSRAILAVGMFAPIAGIVIFLLMRFRIWLDEI